MITSSCMSLHNSEDKTEDKPWVLLGMQQDGFYSTVTLCVAVHTHHERVTVYIGPDPKLVAQSGPGLVFFFFCSLKTKSLGIVSLSPPQITTHTLNHPSQMTRKWTMTTFGSTTAIPREFNPCLEFGHTGRD